MMINLNNYEEFFLLYIDNELSKEQRAAVEAFVLAHPHLAIELDMLQEAKLPMEEAVLFNNKPSLYKADSSININNYEEYFLLHTDKELSATLESEVEQFVLQHPQLQEEFLLLQKTKLTPENMECPDKQRLYKQPAKRVIPLYITRMAIAAAITGIIVLAGNFLIHNNAETHQQLTAKTQKSIPVEKNTMPEKKVDIVVPEKQQQDAIVAKSETKIVVEKSQQLTRKIDKEPVLADKNNIKNEPVITQIDPLPLSQQQVIQAPEEVIASNNAVPKEEHAATLKLLEDADEKEPATTVMYVSNDYTSAKPAVYKELNTNEDDQTLYVGSLQLNKAKVNGLFKKAAHLLGGKSKESNL